MKLRQIVAVCLCLGFVLAAATLAVVWRWHWLSDPQNSTATEAAVAIIIGLPTLLFASLATVAAVQSAQSSQRQAVAADREADAAIAQAEAAREQIKLSKFQFEEERKHFQQQQRIDRLHEIAAYERLSAEDDATRPRFIISGGYSLKNGAGVELMNNGGGDAINLEIAGPTAGKAPIRYGIVRAGKTFGCLLDLVSMQTHPAVCTFKSRLGSTWTLHLRMRGSLEEEVVSVVRPYAIEGPDSAATWTVSG